MMWMCVNKKNILLIVQQKIDYLKSLWQADWSGFETVMFHQGIKKYSPD